MPKTNVPTRLRQEVLDLRTEVATLRSANEQLQLKHAAHFRHCGGGEDCRQFHNESRKQVSLIERQKNYIGFMEQEIQETRNKCTEKLRSIKSSSGALEKELLQVRHELNEIASKAQQVDELQKQVHVLQLKLQRRDNVIEHYAKQHTDIMRIIQDLQSRIVSERERKKAKKALDMAKSKLEKKPDALSLGEIIESNSTTKMSSSEKDEYECGYLRKGLTKKLKKRM